MRTAIVLPLLALLAGCAAVVPPQAWNYDPTRPPAKDTLPPEQRAAITDRSAQLQLERTAIRARIANEPDVRERVRQYEQLHRVGMELSPLPRLLAELGWAR